jgi:hypothetical protein
MNDHFFIPATFTQIAVKPSIDLLNKEASQDFLVGTGVTLGAALALWLLANASENWIKKIIKGILGEFESSMNKTIEGYFASQAENNSETQNALQLLVEQVGKLERALELQNNSINQEVMARQHQIEIVYERQKIQSERLTAIDSRLNIIEASLLSVQTYQNSDT